MEETLEKKYTNEELCELIQSGDTSKQQELMDNCKGVVFSIVRKCDPNNHYFSSKRDAVYNEIRSGNDDYYPRHLDEDLVSVGYKALFEAAKKYDCSGGAKFITYASYRIKGDVLKEIIHQKTTMLHIPSTDEEKYRKFKKEFDKLYGKEITYKEIIVRIADAFKTSVNEVEKVLGIANTVDSLDLLATDDDGNDILLNDVASDEESIEDNYCSEDIKRMLRKFIDELPADEKMAIGHCFGLKGYEELNIDQIAEKYGRSRNTIAKKIKKAEERLRERFKAVGYNT